jgi:calcineurin-like phosphoesterase family protein
MWYAYLMIKIDSPTIGIAGDWHGNTEWALRTLRAFNDCGIKHIFHLGDFGIWGGHDSAKYLLKVNKLLAQNSQKLYVTLGNHEDYVRIYAKPFNEDGFREYQSENLLLLARGARGTIGQRSFVSLGGANSIDYEGRVEGLSWWREESITLADVYKTVEGGEADIFFAHDAPSGVEIIYSNKADGMGWGADAIRYSNAGRETLRHAVDAVKPKVLFHGHHHIYQDVISQMDDGIERYDLRSIGLACDGMENSAIIYNTLSDDYNIMKV